MTCACGCGAPMTCPAQRERARSMLDVVRQLVNTGAIAERDAVRAVTDAMTAFSDAAHHVRDAARLRARIQLRDTIAAAALARAHDEPVEVSYSFSPTVNPDGTRATFRLDGDVQEDGPVGYNARPLTEALRAALPRMIDGMISDSMIGITRSVGNAENESLTIDALRRARDRVLGVDPAVSGAERTGFRFVPPPQPPDRGDVVMDNRRAIGVVESVNANGSVNVHFSGGRGVEARTDVRRVDDYEARRVTPAPVPVAPEPKKLPVRKIILDGDTT